MTFKTEHIAKIPDANGYIHYTAEENQIWQELISRQMPIIQNRACDEYLAGLEILNLPHDHIPQCEEVSQKLFDKTGWSLEPVPALIPSEQFFSLIAKRRFPAATFIRKREELNYLKEPDMFHEVFGHCPLLTHPAYADFTYYYGQLALKASEEEREWLARLYWFTNEFGLIKSEKGLRVYGGGILSSMGETPYSLEDPKPLRKPFDLMEVLRTPYRIDIMQPIYFYIEHFDFLFHLIESDLLSAVHKAQRLKLLPPSFN